MYEKKTTQAKPATPAAKPAAKSKDQSKLKGMTFEQGAAELSPKEDKPKGPASKTSEVTSARAVVTEIRLYEEDMGQIYGHVVVTRSGETEKVPFVIELCWGREFDDATALAQYPIAIRSSALKGYQLSKAAQAELSAGFIKEVMHKANSVDWNSPKFRHTEYATYSFS